MNLCFRLPRSPNSIFKNRDFEDNMNFNIKLVKYSKRESNKVLIEVVLVDFVQHHQ